MSRCRIVATVEHDLEAGAAEVVSVPVELSWAPMLAGVTAAELIERGRQRSMLSAADLERWLLARGFARRNGGAHLLVPTLLGLKDSAAPWTAGSSIDFARSEQRSPPAEPDRSALLRTTGRPRRGRPGGRFQTQTPTSPTFRRSRADFRTP